MPDLARIKLELAKADALEVDTKLLEAAVHDLPMDAALLTKAKSLLMLARMAQDAERELLLAMRAETAGGDCVDVDIPSLYRALKTAREAHQRCHALEKPCQRAEDLLNRAKDAQDAWRTLKQYEAPSQCAHRGLELYLLFPLLTNSVFELLCDQHGFAGV